VFLGSVVVQDRVEAAALREQGITAQAKQVEVERLVGLLLAVALDDDRDGLRRLAGGEGQRAGLGDVVAVARPGGAGPVGGLLGDKDPTGRFVWSTVLRQNH